MKKKVIKLTENDVLKIVKKIISEQEMDNVMPFPPKKDVPKMVTQQTDNVKVKYGTPESVIKAKNIVKKHLMMAKEAMQQLTDMSGVNPEINGICPDIEKVIEKFENLYGDPQPTENEE